MITRAKVLSRIKHTPERYLFPVLAAIAFFIPLISSVSDALTYVVFAMFLTYGLLNRKLLRKRKFEGRRLIILGISLFVLTFFHLFLTENKHAIYSQMDQFTAILVFPLILVMLTPEKDHSKQISLVLNLFAVGTIISSIILFIHACFRFYHTGDTTEFYYIKLGNGIHPSYMSIMVVFAIAILLDGKSFQKIARYTGPIAIHMFINISWLLIFNTLLSSKAGIIVQILILLLFTFRAFYRRLYYKGITLSILVLVSIFVIPLLFPFTAQRFEKFSESVTNTIGEAEPEETTSTNSRILGWKAALDLIMENPYLGVGPGNVQEELMNSYEKHGLGYGYRNPHNQYLQTWLELGLPGLMVLLLIGIISGWIALRDKNYVYLSFLIIMFTHMLFESILERRLGIMTFAFWNSIFWVGSSLPAKKKRPIFINTFLRK